MALSDAYYTIFKLQTPNILFALSLSLLSINVYIFTFKNIISDPGTFVNKK